MAGTQPCRSLAWEIREGFSEEGMLKLRSEKDEGPAK